MKKQDYAAIAIVIIAALCSLIILKTFEEDPNKAQILTLFLALMLWLCTFIRDRIVENVKIEKSLVPIWMELSALSLTIGDEAKWWAQTVQEIEKERNNTIKGYQGPLKKTGLRIFSHFELIALQKNLDKIAELKAPAIDGLIRVLALLRAIEKAHMAYYELEDTIAASTELKPLEKVLRQLENASRMLDSLKRIAVELRYCASQIDKKGKLKNEQMKSLSKADRELLEADIKLIAKWREELGER